MPNTVKELVESAFFKSMDPPVEHVTIVNPAGEVLCNSKPIDISEEVNNLPIWQVDIYPNRAVVHTQEYHTD